MKRKAKEQIKVYIRKSKKMFGHLTAFNRKFPDFLIIGAQKSGTSSLFTMLRQHPRIKPSVIKEVHFFDKNFDKGLYWYKRHFPSKLLYKNHLTGEASPYYIFHPLVPERVANTFPKIKLIAILRDPVDRAYSHYQMVKRNGLEPAENFEEAIAMEESRITGEFETLSRDPYYLSSDFQRYAYLARGRYVEQLERWYVFFPKDQILILKNEDFAANPEVTLNTVFEFLELPSIDIKKRVLFNQGQYKPINPETAKRLRAYFAPFNSKLEDLTGRKFNWEGTL